MDGEQTNQGHSAHHDDGELEAEEDDEAVFMEEDDLEEGIVVETDGNMEEPEGFEELSC